MSASSSTPKKNLDRFNLAIEEWYKNRKALEYLDLEFGKTEYKETPDLVKFHCFSEKGKHIFHTEDRQLNLIADISYLSVHNLASLTDHCKLNSRINLRHFYQIHERSEERDLKDQERESFMIKKFASLQNQIEDLAQQVQNKKPLTKAEVRELVKEIAEQPKLVEQEALRISEDLKEKLKEVEKLLKEVKHTLGS